MRALPHAGHVDLLIVFALRSSLAFSHTDQFSIAVADTTADDQTAIR